MLAEFRAGVGIEAGKTWTQLVPFQFQLSVYCTPTALSPPNRSSVPFALSYAIGARRADGLTMGFCWVQVLATPFHVQVSPSVQAPGDMLQPPNKTTELVAGSYAIAICERSGDQFRRFVWG